MTMRARFGLALLLLTAAASPAAAEFWGVTTAPVRVNGQLVPVGMYVQVAYDGGEFWWTSGYKDADKIPKSSINLIQQLTPRGTNTLAHYNYSCSFYHPYVSDSHPVTSLQADELRANPPDGYAVIHILRMEAGTYVFQFPGDNITADNYEKNWRRVDASCVTPNNKTLTGFPIIPEFKAVWNLQDRPWTGEQIVIRALEVVGCVIGAVFLFGFIQSRR